MTKKKALQKSKQNILNAAADIIENHFIREKITLNCVEETRKYLMFKLSCQEQETFSVMLLDSQHRLIAYKELFSGTIDTAPIYPRQILKTSLQYNAAAVILAHNHPSGITKPSQSDLHITGRIKDILELVDIKVLDHIIVGEDAYSFAENGDL